MTDRPKSASLLSRRVFVRAAAATGAFALFGCAESASGTGSPVPDATANATGTTNGGLSQAEIDDLLFLREEEKVARDVYAVLGAKHGKPFTSIRRSEQSHMDAVLALLATYGLPDPAANTAPGVFMNAELQALYDSLVQDGSASELAALGVGCLIEDYDIHDIDEAMAVATHPDILSTLDNLQLGSRNHLRSFYSRLASLGGSYTPMYIDQATFDAIVTTPQETP